MRWVQKHFIDLIFRLADIFRLNVFFRLDLPVEKGSRKSLCRKSSFSTVHESPIWASVEKVEKGRFSTDKSDLIRTLP